MRKFQSVFCCAELEIADGERSSFGTKKMWKTIRELFVVLRRVRTHPTIKHVPKTMGGGSYSKLYCSVFFGFQLQKEFIFKHFSSFCNGKWMPMLLFPVHKKMTFLLTVFPAILTLGRDKINFKFQVHTRNDSLQKVSFYVFVVVTSLECSTELCGCLTTELSQSTFLMGNLQISKVER